VRRFGVLSAPFGALRGSQVLPGAVRSRSFGEPLGSLRSRGENAGSLVCAAESVAVSRVFWPRRSAPQL
jgi:hypothetical protein